MNIAFIPARCGSQSIPLKNVKDLCGKPLIYWSLKALSNSSNIDKIYVATDCNEIKEVVKGFHLKKVSIYNRNKVNASNTATTESVMLEFIDNNNFDNEDLFILVQATTPFVTNNDFDIAISQLKKEEADSLLSCVRTKRFFWNKNGEPINYNYMSRPRRQEFDGILMENGAFYINKIKNIKRHKNRLSGKIVIYEMPEFTATEADEEDDWIILEQLMYKYIVPKQTSNIKIKLFVTDVDGVLTDAGMYYDENGNELKKFNTHDGMGFKLLREKGIKTAIITSENTNIVKNRAKKLKADYLYQGRLHQGKLDAVKEICKQENIELGEVAYIGDDINDKELLEQVSLFACPRNAVDTIKSIPNIIKLKKAGGNGAVREFIEIILKNQNDN
jgi:N-acylneuraminate cytidylyltransferase